MYEEEVIELRKWRTEVAAALQRPGGVLYEDVPKEIRALRGEIYTQNESIARSLRQLEETRSEIKRSLKYLRDASPRNGPVIRAIEVLEHASEDCFVCGGDRWIDVGDEMGRKQPCPNCCVQCLSGHGPYCQLFDDGHWECPAPHSADSSPTPLERDARDIMYESMAVLSDLKADLDSRHELQNIPEILRGRVDLTQVHARRWLNKYYGESETAEVQNDPYREIGMDQPALTKDRR